MTDDELKDYSKKVKAQADQILSSTNLVHTLEEYGQVFINGSYTLDLMYGADLDIIVATDDIRDSSQNAVKKLIEQEAFQKYEYGDFVKFSREGRPKGYIIVLKTEVDGVKWEVEIWFLNSFEEQKKSLLEIKEKLDESARINILRAKYERDVSGKSKHDLSSFEIYRQALENKS